MSDLASVILRYSEWLDAQGLIVPDDHGNDDRSHDDLVTDFLRELDS